MSAIAAGPRFGVRDDLRTRDVRPLPVRHRVDRRPAVGAGRQKRIGAREQAGLQAQVQAAPRVPTMPPVSARPREQTGLSGLRLTLRGRLLLAVLALGIVLGGIAGGRAVAESPATGTPVETYAVQAGDTLWGIASTLTVPGEDVRDVMVDLQRLNGLSDASLVAGQVLALPVQD